MAYLVGISGGSASGKTTFISRLKEIFNDTEISVLSQDHYYKPLHLQTKDENGEINYDEPESLDIDMFVKDLDNLKAGNEFVIEEYVFNNPHKKPGTITIKSATVVIIEGLFIFSHEMIDSGLDLKVFIDADEEIKYNRRLIRDRDERGMTEEDIHYQWTTQVVPSYQKHLLPFKEKADIVIMNNDDFEVGFKAVIEKLKLMMTPKD